MMGYFTLDAGIIEAKLNSQIFSTFFFQFFGDFGIRTQKKAPILINYDKFYS